MGALVEVDNIGTSGEYLRGRIVDPTGVFNVYAGHYQPEALLSLSNLTIPCFVAVVGKTNAYKPDEETTIVSIRPETIVEIDAKTRDYWVIETIGKTLERVERSQMPETEKEKYRQMCKDALTKLVYMPQEISVPIQETPEVLIPHQEENNPTNPTIEEPAIKDNNNKPDDNELKEKIYSLIIEESNKVPQKVVSYIELAETAKKTLGIEEDIVIEAIKRLMNEGRCYEPRVGFLHPVLNKEKPPDTLPASDSENYAEHESTTSADALWIKDHEDEEPKDEVRIISQKSSSEEQLKPENESSKTLRVQENTESRTKRNSPVKRLTKKKKIERESANNNQKTLFAEASGQE